MLSICDFPMLNCLFPSVITGYKKPAALSLISSVAYCQHVGFSMTYKWGDLKPPPPPPLGSLPLKCLFTAQAWFWRREINYIMIILKICLLCSLPMKWTDMKSQYWVQVETMLFREALIWKQMTRRKLKSLSLQWLDDHLRRELFQYTLRI